VVVGEGEALPTVPPGPGTGPSQLETTGTGNFIIVHLPVSYLLKSPVIVTYQHLLIRVQTFSRRQGADLDQAL
jgi:hypothetical protein